MPPNDSLLTIAMALLLGPHRVHAREGPLLGGFFVSAREAAAQNGKHGERNNQHVSCLQRGKTEYYGTTVVMVYPGFGQAFEDRIAHFKLLELGRAAPGNVAYELTKNSMDETEYALFERWESLPFAQRWNDSSQRKEIVNDPTWKSLTNGTWRQSGYHPTLDSECRDYVQGGFNIDVEATCKQVWDVVTDYDHDCTWIQGCVGVSVDPTNKNLRNLTMENGNIIVQELLDVDDKRLVYEYLSGALVPGFKGTVSIAESNVPGKGCLVGLLFELPKEGEWQSSVEAVYQYQQAITIDYIANLFSHRETEVKILTKSEIETGYLRSKELSALHGDFAEVIARVAGRRRKEYIENRVLSLVHRWLYIIEDPSRNAEPVKEILAERYSLGLGADNVTTFGEFKDWLHGPASGVSASTHVLSEVEVTRIRRRQQYKATMVMSWNGLLNSTGVHMIGKTFHTWTIVDSPRYPYAKIVTMRVETLVPFKPAQKA